MANLLTCESIFEGSFNPDESFQLLQSFAYPKKFGTKISKRQAF